MANLAKQEDGQYFREFAGQYLNVCRPFQFFSRHSTDLTWRGVKSDYLAQAGARTGGLISPQWLLLVVAVGD